MMSKLQNQFQPIVQFLEDNVPDKLESLRGKHTEFEYLLESKGRTLSSENNNNRLGEYKTWLDGSLLSLESVYTDCESIFLKLKDKLKFWKDIRFYGEVMTAITSLTLFFMVFGEPNADSTEIDNKKPKAELVTKNKNIQIKDDNDDWKKFVGPGLVLAASLFTLFANYRTKTSIEGVELDKRILEIDKFLTETDTLKLELERYNHPNPKFDELVLIGQLEKVNSIQVRSNQIKLRHGERKS